MMRMRMVISLMVSLIITIVWPSSSFHRSSYLSANLFSITLVHAEPVVVNQQQSQQPNYIEYNLADYCTETTWSDYPGRHLIRLEKSLKIRLPSILDFQFNETHRQRMGFYRPGIYPNPMENHLNNNNHQQQKHQSQPPFVPYCLLSFTVDYGHRIYAEGLATGLITGGKEWFTETLHFSRRTSTSSSPAIGLKNSQPPEIGTFTISTTKNALTLVFEQLHVGPFSFHLILTPFRDAKPEFMFRCESEHEYQCTNERCIAKYLACDHHNNCGDYSDEHMNCMSRIPTSSLPPGFIPPDGRDSGGREEDYWPPTSPSQPQQPTSPQLPTFPIDSDFDTDRTHEIGGSFDDGDTIPEYIDVPFPGNGDRHKTTHVGGPTKPKPMNGFHGVEVHTGGGFLGDLFRFDSERTSNVVKVVRYLLALLIIIILVTLINFLIWCLITKRDQSFMATASSPAPVEGSTTGGGSSPPPSSSQQPQLPPISVISV
nr:uncharacterized protein LOC124496148 isoform X1 [Dermatophagoides farinae]